MTGQSFLVEQSPLRRHDVRLGLLFLCSFLPVDEISLFWVFRNIFFLFLVYLFQFSLEFGESGFVRRGRFSLLLEALYFIFDLYSGDQK